jgi:phosphotransferase system enzyme I (PtsI)
VERLKGIGVSSGVASGPALVAIQRTQVIRFPIAPDRVARELSALERARRRSHEQLQQIRRRISELKGSDLAAIFDAQLLMLDDPVLVGRAADLIAAERVNAEWAVQRAFDEISAVFNDVEDPYLRERKGDLHDVAGRLRMNLRGEMGGARDLLQDLDSPCVLVADELTPSVVAQLDWTRILGFATDAGSRTYHTAILARSLGVPAVVGLHDVSRRIPAGASVIIDGDSGYPMACASSCTPTSNGWMTCRWRWRPALKGSGSIDRSFCSSAVRPTSRARTSSTRCIATSSRT